MGVVVVVVVVCVCGVCVCGGGWGVGRGEVGDLAGGGGSDVAGRWVLVWVDNGVGGVGGGGGAMAKVCSQARGGWERTLCLRCASGAGQVEVR